MRKIISLSFLGILILLLSCRSDDDQNPGTIINNGLGIIQISGDLSDEEAINLINTNLGDNTHTLLIKNTTNLTKLDFSDITTLVFLEIEDNAKLTNVKFPQLTTVASEITVYNNAQLETIELDELQYTGVITIESNPFIAAIALPKLIEAEDISLSRNLSIETIAMSQLQSVSNGISITEMPVLNSVSFSNLKYCQGNLRIYANDVLENIELSSLISTGIDFSYSKSEGDISIYDNNITLLDLQNLEQTTSIVINEQSLTAINLENLKTSEKILLIAEETLIEVNLSNIEDFSRLLIFAPANMEALMAKLVAITPPITNTTIQMSGEVSVKTKEYIDILENGDNTVSIRD
ncbi:hypothetical protein GCM10022393_08320 [Aquimarina addita]|uniref:Receptor L-domain domain-containing protein n=1 Tax=Aquimarina addita TaxID=870485 RepID=A0ABP7XBZ0_9FLAO